MEIEKENFKLVVWKDQKGNKAIGNKDGVIYLYPDDVNNNLNKEEMNEVLNVIKAAPDLLRTAKNIIKHLEKFCDQNDIADFEDYIKLRKAIAKAESRLCPLCSCEVEESGLCESCIIEQTEFGIKQGLIP